MTTPKPKRRPFQFFSLRTLMVFVSICAAIPCVWLAVKMDQARQDRLAAAAIERLGGTVTVNERSVPRWLNDLVGNDFFAAVGDVGLSGARVTDDRLEPLQRLSQLRYLLLDGTEVTGPGLEYLEGLSRLHTLNIQHAKVTDDGLKYLSGLRQLQTLTLHGTEFTDAGLEHLKGLSQLKNLFLDRNRITDAGLEHLKGLDQLRFLNLSSTKVTKEGVKKLEQSLPNCRIIH